MFKTFYLYIVLLIMLVALGACAPARPSSTTEPVIESISTPPPTVSPFINLIDVEGSGLFVQQDGNVTLNLVSSSERSWVCIQADQDGQPGNILGCTAVPAGENKDVAVKLDSTKLTRLMYTTLYVDKGTPGQMEIPNPDEPALTATGKPLVFPETLVGDLSWITTEDQILGEGNTVVIPRVYTPIPALLVIHDGRSPVVIGWATLQAGENLDVIVILTTPSKTNNLGAMLHWDGGEPGKYQNFILDPNAITQTGEVLVVQFNLK